MCNLDEYKFQQPDDSFFAVKEQCERCKNYCDKTYIFNQNVNTYFVCSECLNELHQ